MVATPTAQSFQSRVTQFVFDLGFAAVRGCGDLEAVESKL